MYVTKRRVIEEFWRNHMELSKKTIKSYDGAGLMYTTDTRVAFIDYIDHLNRDNRISQELADTITLDPRQPRKPKPKIETFFVLRVGDNGPEVHPFKLASLRDKWLACQDDTVDDYFTLSVVDGVPEVETAMVGSDWDDA